MDASGAAPGYTWILGHGDGTFGDPTMIEQVPGLSGASWSIGGVEDFDGDGTVELATFDGEGGGLVVAAIEPSEVLHTLPDSDSPDRA